MRHAALTLLLLLALDAHGRSFVEVLLPPMTRGFDFPPAVAMHANRAVIVWTDQHVMSAVLDMDTRKVGPASSLVPLWTFADIAARGDLLIGVWIAGPLVAAPLDGDGRPLCEPAVGHREHEGVPVLHHGFA